MYGEITHEPLVEATDKDEKTIHTPGRWQSKMLILSRNVDQKSLETTLFLSIFDPLIAFSIATYPV